LSLSESQGSGSGRNPLRVAGADGKAQKTPPDSVQKKSRFSQKIDCQLKTKHVFIVTKIAPSLPSNFTQLLTRSVQFPLRNFSAAGSSEIHC
jgi:hypothetical protein